MILVVGSDDNSRNNSFGILIWGLLDESSVGPFSHVCNSSKTLSKSERRR